MGFEGFENYLLIAHFFATMPTLLAQQKKEQRY